MYEYPFSKRFSYWPLWGCAGDWVDMVSKCIVGLLWGTHFQHGGKFVPQSSPTMHFDNHLDPVSQPTSKWRIEKYIDSLILLSSCTCARVHFHLLLSIVKLTRFNDKFSLRQILCSSLQKKKKGCTNIVRNSLDLHTLECWRMRNSVSCRSYNCCRYRIRGKTSKILIFTTTQMKWKKSDFETADDFFF